MSLFERAAALVPPTELDLALETELGDALFWTGRRDDALRRADALAERASAAGDRVGELCGRIQGGVFRLQPRAGGNGEAGRARRASIARVPGRRRRAGSLHRLLRARVEAGADSRSQQDAALEAYEQAVAHARKAGHLPAEILASRAALRFFGTTPASELLAWLDENEPPAGRDHFLRAYRAGTLAMLGRFDEARTILAETRAELAERGAGVLLANITAFESVWVELWAGDPTAAAEFGAEGWRLYEELGEQSFLPTAAGHLARALYALDRLDEADAWAGRAAELGASDDAWTQMLWRQVRAKVLARRGEHAEAELLAREAVAICDETDMLNAQGDAYADLAEVLMLAGRPTRQPPRSSRRSNATSARATSSRRSARRRDSPNSKTQRRDEHSRTYRCALASSPS